MKKITITTEIAHGKFQRNRNRIMLAIRAFEGKIVDLTIRRATKQRSENQNRYYWGVIVPIWQDLLLKEWGELRNKEYTHEFLKANCGYEERVNEATGEILRVPKSTTENTTVEQEEYHTACRLLAHDMFGVEIPLPNEQLKLEA